MTTLTESTRTEERIAIDAKALRGAVSRLCLVAASNRGDSLSILHHILISPGEGCIRMEATNLNIWLRVTLPASSTGNLPAVCVPARVLRNLLAGFSGEIQVGIDDKHFTLTDARKRISVITRPLDGFPIFFWPETDEWQCHPWFLSDSRSLLKFASQDETRIALTGIYWEPGAMTATNTHMLATRYHEPQEGWEPVILPGKTVGLLPRLLGLKPEDGVDVMREGGNILFRSGDSIMVSRLIEGNYPNYQRVIDEFPRPDYWIVDNTDFASALKSILPIALANKNEWSPGPSVTLHQEGQSLIAEVEDISVGQASVNVDLLDGATGGPDFRIAVDGLYMIDCLGHFPPHCDVKIGMRGPMESIMVSSRSYSNRLVILMPMQLR